MSSRRLFLRAATSSGILGVLPFYSTWAHDRIATANQTKGPFYPIPDIEKQEFFDVDLTRKDANSPVADGEIVAIAGTVITLHDKPISNAIVEVWQACETGRYNHPQDKNDRPIDPNFQYWGRMATGEKGEFRFKTILPGKYPGRTPHIHFRIVAKDRPELVTQLYFAMNEELNRKDGVYMGLNVAQRDNVTTGFEKIPVDPTKPNGDKIQTGNFTIVLGPVSDSKSTQPM
jgi:protocatechuate 3,4-dioxygenase, beta subunit